MISIHAAREGGDCRLHEVPRRRRRISIHAAREGGDELLALSKMLDEYFNPRRP